MEVLGEVKIRSDEHKSEEEEAMPPGFRFHPTDEELVGYYLQRKVEKKPLRIELIMQINIYEYDPWDLPRSSNVEGEKEGYFFCRRGRKYRNSERPNRVTLRGSGFWKATGIDKPIYGVADSDRDTRAHTHIIGLKKSLVYYRGAAGRASKTDWMMHEFRLPHRNTAPPRNSASAIDGRLQEAEVWTLCKIFKRTPSYKKYTEAATKPSPAHSTSETISLGSDVNGKPCLTFKDSLIIQQTDERKQIINNIEKVEDERNHLFLGQLAQSPPPLVSYPSSWNSGVVEEEEEDVFANGNWDELRPMIELAMDYSSIQSLL